MFIQINKLFFKITYVNYEGGISNYHPDFVIHLNNNERFIVETKGAENLNDPRKIERLKQWCEDATQSTGKIYKHLYIKQEDWTTFQFFYIPTALALSCFSICHKIFYP